MVSVKLGQLQYIVLGQQMAKNGALPLLKSIQLQLEDLLHELFGPIRAKHKTDGGITRE